jgi:hypothetical protein
MVMVDTLWLWLPMPEKTEDEKIDELIASDDLFSFNFDDETEFSRLGEKSRRVLKEMIARRLQSKSLLTPGIVSPDRTYIVGGCSREVETGGRFSVEMGPYSMAALFDKVIVPNPCADEASDLRVEIVSKASRKFSFEQTREEGVTSFEKLRGSKIAIGETVVLTGVNTGTRKIFRAACLCKQDHGDDTL